MHSKLRFINNSLKCCNPERISKEIRDLELMLQDAKTYYPFRISSWDDNTKFTMSSYFVSIRDESRYQSADTSGTYGSSSYGLNQDDDFDLRQSVHAA